MFGSALCISSGGIRFTCSHVCRIVAGRLNIYICTSLGESEFTSRNCLRALSQSPRREVCLCSGALCVYHPAEPRFTCSNVYRIACTFERPSYVHMYIFRRPAAMPTCESGIRRVIYTPLGLSVQRGTAERTRNRGTAVSTYILYSDMSSPRGQRATCLLC